MKTSQKHLNLFKSECLRLQKAWGLLEWELNFCHDKISSLASCDARFGSRNAYLSLATEWEDKCYPPTDENIRNTAKHEMLHLLLAPLEDSVNKRFLTREMASDAGHAVLQRLMQLIP